MPGPKTNEREGTRAVLRDSLTSPYKVRVVLDLIRGLDVQRAREVLRFSERDAAIIVGKLLDSAVANAQHNDELDPEELFVSACYADEGRTLKRWRPRARGRATRIRKRTCHVTIIVSRLPEDQLARLRAKQEAALAGRRARRVAGGRRGDATPAADEGGRRRRSRGRKQEDAATTDAPVTDEATVDAESVEEAGIVDQQAPAVEAAEDAAASDAPEAVVEPEATDTVVEAASGDDAPEATEEEGK